MIGREDPRWNTLRRGFNLRWVADPDAIAVCESADDVVAAVQGALDRRQRITVRSGGHCYEDFVCDNERGVIVDMAPMTGIGRDPGSGLYSLEGGCTNWDVYVRLYKEFGVTLPAGSCYSVGAGGHFTGGGYGLLSRRDGLTVDYLHGVEVVRVNEDRRAELRTVMRDSSDPEEREMLWAHLGGGGGNFGIVTKFFFADPPRAPSDAWILSLAWPWSSLDCDSFARLLANYGGFLEQNSGVGSEWSGLFSLLHLNQNAGDPAQVVLTAQYVGPRPELLREFGAAMSDGVGEPEPQKQPCGYHHMVRQGTEPAWIPWLYATQTLNGSGPNRRGKYKSSYMKRGFPTHQVDALFEYLHDYPLQNPKLANPNALVQVDSYGCQVNAVASDACAIPQRSSIMKLQFQTYWTDAAQDDQNLEWIRAVYDRMYGAAGPWPDEVMDGCYVNYPDVDLRDWQYLYYKENYPRLRRAKRLWDPLNVFHHQQSIEPE